MNPGSASWQCLLARRFGAGGASAAGARTDPQFGSALLRSACRNSLTLNEEFFCPFALGNEIRLMKNAPANVPTSLACDRKARRAVTLLTWT